MTERIEQAIAFGEIEQDRDDTGPAVTVHKQHAFAQARQCPSRVQSDCRTSAACLGWEECQELLLSRSLLAMDGGINHWLQVLPLERFRNYPMHALGL